MSSHPTAAYASLATDVFSEGFIFDFSAVDDLVYIPCPINAAHVSLRPPSPVPPCQGVCVCV